MTADPTDKELEKLLCENSALTTRYRENSSARPAAALDRKILDAARTELETKNPRRVRQFNKTAWARPVSIAAIMLLSVSVVITMQQQSVDTGERVGQHGELDINGTTVPFSSDKKTLTEPESNNDTLEFSSSGYIQPGIKQGRSTDNRTVPTDRRMPAPEAALIPDPANTDSARLQQDRRHEMSKAGRAVDLEEAPAAMPSSHAALTLNVAPASKEEALLDTLRSLINRGELDAAAEILKRFTDENPDYTAAAIQELIGPAWYDMLKNR